MFIFVYLQKKKINCFYLQAGIEAAAYNASLSEKVRANVQNEWMNNKIKVICATTAFGRCI